jgi:hypothetical protein
MLAVGVLMACDGPRSSTSSDGGGLCTIKNRFQTSVVNRRMDFLFVIDNSPGMASMKTRLAAELPRFVDALAALPGGVPDLHMAVVTSSMGAGRFANVPGCETGGPGDGGGRFVHPAACAALRPDQSFIITDHGRTNFSGGLHDLVGCLVDVGVTGCPISQPLAAMRAALEKGMDPRDPDNGGFLRSDSELVVLLVTNQDDCSVPADSDLFDPLQTPSPYRCAEFGHTCGGQRPPHELPAGVDTLALGECIAPDDGGGLTPVAAFDDFMRGLRTGGNAALAILSPPHQPYVIQRESTGMTSPGGQSSLALAPSCRGRMGETGTPAPRIRSWAEGARWPWALQPICEDSWLDVAAAFVTWLGASIGPNCIGGKAALRSDGTPDCEIFTRTLVGSTGQVVDEVLPLCDAHHANYPCWSLVPEPFCQEQDRLVICNDPSCAGWESSSQPQDVFLTCAKAPPCE